MNTDESVSSDVEEQPLLPEINVSRDDSKDQTELKMPLNLHNKTGHMKREFEHSTSSLVALVHLLKANIGMGVLAMPQAMAYAGLGVGLLGLLLIGAICIYCMHMLVNCCHELCLRLQENNLTYAQVAELSFQHGPVKLQKYSIFMRLIFLVVIHLYSLPYVFQLGWKIVNLFLCITQMGFCCVYAVFVAMVDHYFPSIIIRVEYYFIMLLPLYIMLCSIRNLKYLAPISTLANVALAISLIIIFKYLLTDIPDVYECKLVSSWEQLPFFFGMIVFAYESIGVVSIILDGVLVTSMNLATLLYVAMSFYGYLKYGDDAQGSVTLNLPRGDPLAVAVTVLIVVDIFFSFPLQFYVPIEIMLPYVLEKVSPIYNVIWIEYGLRLVLLLFTFLLAATIPKIELFIALVGCWSSTFLALCFPPIIETAVSWPCWGKGYWRLWKNAAICIFGLLGFATGSYVTMNHLIDSFRSK